MAEQYGPTGTPLYGGGTIPDYSHMPRFQVMPPVQTSIDYGAPAVTNTPVTATPGTPVVPAPAAPAAPVAPVITPQDIAFGASAAPAVAGDPMANFMNYGGNYGATPSMAAPGATAGVPAATGGWLPEGLSGGLFGKGWGSLQGWGTAIGGVGDLLGAWNGMQQTKLAREQFGFSKAMANRNLANQAAVTNQALRDRRSGRRAVFGGNKGTGAQVSGAPVG